ncbi:DUF4331 family protein [Nonomuraea sp. NPDC050790]|uniref:DUF4331 family protein n=1 Tax=Nonomuraea sp. NPDC050790 TaxID=3364371 RepID=UPI003787E246
MGFGADPVVVRQGWLTLSVGLRSGPLFADLGGIGNDLTWTGDDTVAGHNVISIAMEMPDEILGQAPLIGLWGRVSVERDGRWVSVDRGAHPSLTAYFNAEEAYDAREPDDVTDLRLRMISNGRIRGDGIGPHADLLPGFPYTGPPHL